MSPVNLTQNSSGLPIDRSVRHYNKEQKLVHIDLERISSDWNNSFCWIFCSFSANCPYILREIEATIVIPASENKYANKKIFQIITWLTDSQVDSSSSTRTPFGDALCVKSKVNGLDAKVLDVGSHATDQFGSFLESSWQQNNSPTYW